VICTFAAGFQYERDYATALARGQHHSPRDTPMKPVFLLRFLRPLLPALPWWGLGVSMYLNWGSHQMNGSRIHSQRGSRRRTPLHRHCSLVGQGILIYGSNSFRSCCRLPPKYLDPSDPSVRYRKKKIEKKFRFVLARYVNIVD